MFVTKQFVMKKQTKSATIPTFVVEKDELDEPMDQWQKYI